MRKDWEYEVSPMYRVQVYYNLHKHCYSIRQSGRVIGHTDSIVLRDARFNVAPAGRDKVRATGVKNVHATVSGYVASPYHSEYHDGYPERLDDACLYDCDFVSYNPFKYDQFVKITSNGYDGFYTDPVQTADYVALLPNREIRSWGTK